MLCKQNIRLFWKEIKSGDQVKRSGISDEISLDQWYNYFEELHQEVEDNDMGNDLYGSLCVQGLDKDIKVEELTSAVQSLKGGKAPGIDGMIPELFKYLVKYQNKIKQHLYIRRMN